MIQQNLLELAKQGDAQAIAALMNRQLQTRQILAKAELKEGCLQLLLESSTVPPQEQLVSYIWNALKKLEPVAIEKVIIYGKKTDSDFPSWQEKFDLHTSLDLNSLSIENNSTEKSLTKSVNKDSNLLKCEGHNSILTVRESGVLIERLGGFLSAHPKGEKIISYNRIEAIQFYTPTTLKYGFIHFKLVDSMTNNLKYLEAASNLNTVVFLENKLLDFNKARYLILKKIDSPTQDINVQKEVSTTSPAIEVPDQKVDSPVNNTIQINVNSGPQMAVNSGPQIACPKCGSNQIASNKKGFNVGQALVGGIAGMGVGAVAGFWGSNEIRLNCLFCGNRWKP